MRFAKPDTLYLLLLLIPIIILLLISHRRRQATMAEFLTPRAQEKNCRRSGPETEWLKAGLLTLGSIFLVLALARPQWGERYEKASRSGLIAVFLLDTSNSMNAEDLLPNRLEAAKNLITRSAAALSSDLLGQVNFAATAYVQCPLTYDNEAVTLLSRASTISPGEEQGTDFAAAFLETLRMLKTASSPGAKEQLVVLISDGEDQEKSWANALDRLRKRSATVITVGIGTADGAPIPIRDRQGKISDWKRDNQGRLVKSRLDESTLSTIAARTGGRYFRMDDDRALFRFLAELKSTRSRVLAQKIKALPIERFYYPLWLGILCLAGEMVLSEKRWPWPKSSPC